MENHDKALQQALAQIEKQYGKGSVIQMDKEQEDIEAIPTGSINLNIALGIKGIPKGRIVEVYGPESSGKTTLMYHFIAECQKAGGRAVFIDSEHSMDAQYASRIGVNIEELLVSQPDYGEQALEIADTLVRSGAVDLIAIDSVAALTPKAELEGMMGQSTIGLQARMMSQALRKIAGNLNNTQTTLVFTNQIREKVGVMFGCMHYNTRVKLADGTSEKIGKIVNQKMEVDVLSYNPITKLVEPKPIKNWFDNGVTDTFLQFEIEGGVSGKRTFACTPNHTIMTLDGEKSAEELQEGDYILAETMNDSLSQEQETLTIGSILGDGSLRKASNQKTSLRFSHGLKQSAYLEWKHGVFGSYSLKQVVNSKGGLSFDTIAMTSLNNYLDVEYHNENQELELRDWFIDKIDIPSLAVWYMDDGTLSGSYKNNGSGKAEISAKRFSDTTRTLLANKLKELDLEPTFVNQKGFMWSGEKANKLFNAISPYIHTSMKYKIPEQFVSDNKWNDLSSEIKPVMHTANAAKITKIYQKPLEAGRNHHKYDLEIADNHTYLVDGAVVHNSPETQPGGRALRFYASVRMDIRRKAQIKGKDEDGNEVVTGNETKVKIVKNKVAPPFREAEFDIMFGEGISRPSEILVKGVDLDILTKSGAFYSYGDQRLGQGKENAKIFLKENPELMNDLEAQIMDIVLKKNKDEEEEVVTEEVNLEETKEVVEEVK